MIDLLKLSQSNIKSVALFKLMDNQVWDYLLDSLRQYVKQESN